MTNSGETIDTLIERALRWVLTQPPGAVLGLAPGDEDAEGSGLTTDDLDAALREAKHRDLLRGERRDYGTVCRWSKLEVAGAGLRFIAAWPPVGREHHEGRWSDGHWGGVAVPVLQRVRDGAYRGNLITGLNTGTSDEGWRERLAVQELLAVGYLDGGAMSKSHLGFSDLRLTSAGAEALDPTPRDSLDEARVRLRTSALEAVIHAVEIALGDRLRAHGRAHGFVSDDPDVHKQLSFLNDSLTGKAGPRVYGKPWKTTIDVLLDIRNEYGHGRGDALPDNTAEVVLSVVELVLSALPPAPD